MYLPTAPSLHIDNIGGIGRCFNEGDSTGTPLNSIIMCNTKKEEFNRWRLPDSYATEYTSSEVMIVHFIRRFTTPGNSYFSTVSFICAWWISHRNLTFYFKIKCRWEGLVPTGRRYGDCTDILSTVCILSSRDIQCGLHISYSEPAWPIVCV